jgi:hypothetical protein
MIVAGTAVPWDRRYSAVDWCTAAGSWCGWPQVWKEGMGEWRPIVFGLSLSGHRPTAPTYSVLDWLSLRFTVLQRCTAVWRASARRRRPRFSCAESLTTAVGETTGSKRKANEPESDGLQRLHKRLVRTVH